MVGLLFLSITVGFSALAEPCMPGNIPFFDPFDEDPIASAWCCVPVGDGTVLSCTDGDTWFNVPSIDTVD
jgi:hypothetical protein